MLTRKEFDNLPQSTDEYTAFHHIKICGVWFTCAEDTSFEHFYPRDITSQVSNDEAYEQLVWELTFDAADLFGDVDTGIPSSSNNSQTKQQWF